MLSLESNDKDILYYDGSCPLCSAEVGKLAKHSSDNLQLVNIHDLEQFCSLPGKRVLLERLHLKTAEGEWLIGIDANIRAWRNTPYGWLWRPLGWPVLRIFSAAAYQIWQKVRR